MALKQFKPYTKSTRSTILTDRSDLWKGKPYKPLTSPNKSVKGRKYIRFNFIGNGNPETASNKNYVWKKCNQV